MLLFFTIYKLHSSLVLLRVDNQKWSHAPDTRRCGHGTDGFLLDQSEDSAPYIWSPNPLDALLSPVSRSYHPITLLLPNNSASVSETYDRIWKLEYGNSLFRDFIIFWIGSAHRKNAPPSKMYVTGLRLLSDGVWNVVQDKTDIHVYLVSVAQWLMMRVRCSSMDLCFCCIVLVMWKKRIISARIIFVHVVWRACSTCSGWKICVFECKWTVLNISCYKQLFSVFKSNVQGSDQ